MNGLSDIDIWGYEPEVHTHNCEKHGIWSCDGTVNCGKCPECDYENSLKQSA